MDLCGGDSALMARHYGGVQSMNNFFNMFLNRESPSIGLSPRYRLTQAAYSARGLALRRHRAPEAARARPRRLDGLVPAHRPLSHSGPAPARRAALLVAALRRQLDRLRRDEHRRLRRPPLAQRPAPIHGPGHRLRGLRGGRPRGGGLLAPRRGWHPAGLLHRRGLHRRLGAAAADDGGNPAAGQAEAVSPLARQPAVQPAAARAQRSGPAPALALHRPLFHDQRRLYEPRPPYSCA